MVLYNTSWLYSSIKVIYDKEINPLFGYNYLYYYVIIGFFFEKRESSLFKKIRISDHAVGIILDY